MKRLHVIYLAGFALLTGIRTYHTLRQPQQRPALMQRCVQQIGYLLNVLVLHLGSKGTNDRGMLATIGGGLASAKLLLDAPIQRGRQGVAVAAAQGSGVGVVGVEDWRVHSIYFTAPS
jgi:hypothetical protein